MVINEIYPDYAGSTSWIELYNSSSSEVSLDFWQIDTGSDETAESYLIPFGDPVPSGGFLVLELGTTTLVIAKTGTLRLIGIDLETYEPVVADQVDYAISEDGHAYARVPDGSSTWLMVSKPSKGAANPTPTPTPSPTPTPTPTPTPPECPSNPSLSVVINEVFPGNANEQSSWAELYNRGSALVELTCWSVDTGSGTNFDAYLLPVGTQIEPGGFLVIGEAATVFPFPMSGTVRLLDPDGDVVDEIDYTITGAGAAIARAPNGSSTWAIISTPTKGAANPTPTPTPSPTPTSTPTPLPTPTPIPTPMPSPIPSPTPVPTPTPTPSPTPTPTIPDCPTNESRNIVFNEVFHSLSREETGYIELYNLASVAANLTCWSLDRGIGAGEAPYVLPVDTQIDPGGFLIIEKVEKIFPLAKSGKLRLLDGYGEVVNEVDYAIAEEAVGRARIPDGTGDWVDVSTRTMGVSNETPTPTPSPRPIPRPPPEPAPPTPSPAPTTPLPQFLRITEIYYDGQIPRTEGDEFIEIQNQGTTTAYLGRVRILIQSATARSPVAYGFPSRTKLAPGEIIVTAKNARQFAAHFGTQPDFEARASGAGYSNSRDVPNLVHDRRISRRTWALANTGATVALIGDNDAVIDAIAYGYDPDGYMGLYGIFPSASGGQSLERIFARNVDVRASAALRQSTPSPGAIPPPPTPTPLPTPTPTPSPTPTPIPTPSPTPTPTPTPTSLPTPTPTATPTPTPDPTPIPAPTATPAPRPTAAPRTPPPPTPTATVLQCLTDIQPQEQPRLVGVTGSVTEVREMPKEIRVFLADNCGGAMLHLAVDELAPPTRSYIHLTAVGSRRDMRIDLYLAPGASIEYLSGKESPRAIPFTQAVIQRAPTGTWVRTGGNVTYARDETGHAFYETSANYIRLDPQARAVPTGPVTFYGIIEWREAIPLLRVHYIAPAKPRETSLRDTIRDWKVIRHTLQYARDVFLYLAVRSLTRGHGRYLPW